MNRYRLILVLWAFILLSATPRADAQMGYAYRPYAYGGYAYYYPRVYSYNVGYGGLPRPAYSSYSYWVNAGYPFRTYSYYSNFSGAYPTYGYIYGYPYYSSAYRPYGW